MGSDLEAEALSGRPVGLRAQFRKPRVAPYRLGAVFVSWRCCDKCPRTGCLRATEVCAPAVLEAGSPESRGPRGAHRLLVPTVLALCSSQRVPPAPAALAHGPSLCVPTQSSRKDTSHWSLGPPFFTVTSS